MCAQCTRPCLRDLIPPSRDISIFVSLLPHRTRRRRRRRHTHARHRAEFSLAMSYIIAAIYLMRWPMTRFYIVAHNLRQSKAREKEREKKNEIIIRVSAPGTYCALHSLTRRDRQAESTQKRKNFFQCVDSDGAILLHFVWCVARTKHTYTIEPLNTLCVTSNGCTEKYSFALVREMMIYWASFIIEYICLG